MSSHRDDETLQLEEISAGYGYSSRTHAVVRDISLTVSRGESLVLLGQNGAGKSTLLRAIFGLNNVLSGRLYVSGYELRSTDPVERIRRGVAYVPQGRGVFQDLTVTENLYVSAHNVKRDVDARVKSVRDRIPALYDLGDAKGGTLSGGQARLLSIGMALVRRPAWLLLDEPTIGLAPDRVDSIFELINDLRRSNGLGVIIAEQNVMAAIKWFDKALCLRGGEKHWSGDCDGMRRLSPIELAELL